MKRKINKETFDKLSDEKKADYKEKNGEYFLIIEDEDEAVETLRRAKENEVENHKETKKKLKELESQLEELTHGSHKKAGDIEALENSWKTKFNTRETELTTEIGRLKNIVSSSLKDSALTSLAAKLVKPESHRLFKRSIEDRFNVEIEGEKSTLRILDIHGKPSALTLEDLEKEILANKEYSPIIIASRASGAAGGSDTKSRGAGGTEHLDKEGKPLNLAGLSPVKLAEALTASKTTEK